MLDDLFTVPNLFSLLRLGLVPVFWWLLLGEGRVGSAAVLILVVAGTDWIDGYLARRLGQVTELGKFLDPLADRLMIASAVLGGVLAGVVPYVIGVPLLAREVLVGLGAVYAAARGRQLEVRPLGKTATFLLYGAVPAFYLSETGFLSEVFAPPAWLAGVVGLWLYYWVAGQYARDVLCRVRNR